MRDILTNQDIFTVIDGEVITRFKGSIISQKNKNDGVILQDGRIVLFNKKAERWEYIPQS